MADRFQGESVVLSLRKAMTEAAIVTEAQKVRTVFLEYHHHNNSPFANFFPRITGKENLIGISWVRCPPRLLSPFPGKGKVKNLDSRPHQGRVHAMERDNLLKENGEAGEKSQKPSMFSSLQKQKERPPGCQES